MKQSHSVQMHFATLLWGLAQLSAALMPAAQMASFFQKLAVSANFCIILYMRHPLALSYGACIHNFNLYSAGSLFTITTGLQDKGGRLFEGGLLLGAYGICIGSGSLVLRSCIAKVSVCIKLNIR